MTDCQPAAHVAITLRRDEPVSLSFENRRQQAEPVAGCTACHAEGIHAQDSEERRQQDQEEVRGPAEKGVHREMKCGAQNPGNDWVKAN